VSGWLVVGTSSFRVRKMPETVEIKENN